MNRIKKMWSDKKGLTIERFMVSILFFGIFIVLGITFFISNSYNYSHIIENNNNSQFVGLEGQIEKISAISTQQQEEILGGEFKDEQFVLEGGKQGFQALRFAWDSGILIRNVSTAIVKEIDAGGDEDGRTSKILEFLRSNFITMMSILFIMALVYLLWRFKAQD